MPAYTASAPGKIILFGEHAVVYGRSAIAVPVADVMAKATISPAISVQQGQISIDAPDIGLKSTLNNLPKDNPIAVAILSVMRHLEVGELPSFHLKITSSIPVSVKTFGIWSPVCIKSSIRANFFPSFPPG